MRTVCVQLRGWYLAGDDYPPLLSSLINQNPNPAIFVCPATGHAAGRMASVEDWTDYIYVAGPYDFMADVAVLICPPENHGGKYGHILWGSGVIEELPPDRIKALIKEPWCMPTAARGSIHINLGPN